MLFFCCLPYCTENVPNRDTETKILDCAFCVLLHSTGVGICQSNPELLPAYPHYSHSLQPRIDEKKKRKTSKTPHLLLCPFLRFMINKSSCTHLYRAHTHLSGWIPSLLFITFPCITPRHGGTLNHSSQNLVIL